MHRNIYIIINLLLVFNCISSAQHNLDTNLKFPMDWLGEWKGDLFIYGENGLKQVLPMSITCIKSDTLEEYTWSIVYNTDAIIDERPYSLQVIDSTKGHYMIDERNSIKIDAYQRGNSLISSFSVQNNVIIASYERVEDYLLFEITMFKELTPNITGGTMVNGEDIPLVKSFDIPIYQRAKLYKTTKND